MGVQSSVGKGELGLAGAIIVAAEILSSGYSNHNLSAKIDELQGLILNIRSNTEQNYVRKQDLASLEQKIDELRRLVKL